MENIQRISPGLTPLSIIGVDIMCYNIIATGYLETELPCLYKESFKLTGLVRKL